MFFVGCTIEGEVYSAGYVLEYKEALLNRVIIVEGVVEQYEEVCSLRRCSSDNPCCNTCVASLGFEVDGEYLGIKGDDVGCSGSECSLECGPFEEDGNYRVKGYLREENGEYYLELISFEVASLIGGDTDEHGCIGSAGYTFDEDVGACIREWELDETQKEGAKIAVTSIGKVKGLHVNNVEIIECIGCFDVEIKRGSDTLLVKIQNWEVI